MKGATTCKKVKKGFKKEDIFSSVKCCPQVHRQTEVWKSAIFGNTDKRGIVGRLGPVLK